MRKTFRFLCITALTGCSLLGISSCGDDYDDSELRDRLEQIEDRVAKLEEWCTTANGEIAALRGLIAALENKDYVTGVETLEDGYRITFSKSESIVIRNGKDGYTPVIGVAKHSDGLYYWTIQSEDGKTAWLTDNEGNMIHTTGDNGEDAHTPIVKSGKELGGSYITDAVYLSVDGGATWTKISGDKGDKGDNGSQGPQGGKGDSIFESVNEAKGYLEVKLANGSKIRLSYYSSALRFKDYETANVNINGIQIEVILPDNLEEDNYDLLIATVAPVSGATTRASNGWTVSITQPDFNNTPVTATVTVKGDDDLLDAGDQALLSVILTYKDGTQATASRLVEFIPPIGNKKTDDAAVGDFYMSDGSLVDKDATLTPEQMTACIGIVYWLDEAQKIKDDNYGLLDSKFPNGIHGLVVSLWDMSDATTAWGGGYFLVSDWLKNSTWSGSIDRPSSFISIQVEDKMQGYANTIALEEYNKCVNNVWDSNVRPVNNLAAFEKAHPAPSNSSGWYWPSVCELKYVCWGQGNENGINGKTMLNKQIEKINKGNKFELYDQYFSSTEKDNIWVWSVSCNGGKVSSDNGKKSVQQKVRFILAF